MAGDRPAPAEAKIDPEPVPRLVHESKVTFCLRGMQNGFQIVD